MKLTERTTVVLTGFGSFPGITRNASIPVIEGLASIARDAYPTIDFVSDILPVDWQEAPRRIDDLISAHNPVLALHFGVSNRTSGFVIEEVAYNEAHTHADARGSLHSTSPLVPGGRPSRKTTLPARTILETLKRAGLPAALSRDPGRYLCNAVMYKSLCHARTRKPHLRSGFIHIPATLDPAAEGEPTRLDRHHAIVGAGLILRACLAPLHGGQHHLS